jgi:ankyrin repeat protein
MALEPNLKFSKEQRNAVAMKMIEKGADVNIGFEDNDKPINWAIHNGDPELVKAMIKRGRR